MKSILNIPVSAFEHVKGTAPRDVNLLTWLTSDKYRDKVELIRKTKDEYSQKILKKDPALYHSRPAGSYTAEVRSLLNIQRFHAFRCGFSG